VQMNTMPLVLDTLLSLLLDLLDNDIDRSRSE
jgi:hypothetical protein